MNIYHNSSHLFVVLSLITTVFIFSCYSLGQGKDEKHTTTPKFDSIQLSPSSKYWFNSLFGDMKEDVGIFGNNKEQRLKSSTVQFIFSNDSLGTIVAMEKSKCNAMMKGDTLRIEIGDSDGFTGHGLTVKCVGNRFTTRFHRFFDSNPAFESRMTYTIEKQTLYLDKSDYAVGDSIFGTIYARQLDNEGLKHYASGMFRTRVEAGLYY